MLRLVHLNLDNKWLRHALPFGLLLLLQVTLVLLREPVPIVGDEAGYLANARYLSGTAPMPTLYKAPFHSFGYSLFLVPALRLFENPYTAYSVCLIINAFLMSTLYFSLHYILSALLDVPSRLAMIIAVITCLYPPLLLRANFAWSENAYVPAFMLLTVLFGTLLRNKSILYAIAFGLLLGFMYTIHPRSLPLLPTAALCLAFLGFYRALPWRLVSVGLAVTSIVFFGTRLVMNHLRVASGTEFLELPILPVITHLLSLQGIYNFLLKINELILYLVQSSYGLFPISLLAIAYFLWYGWRKGFSGFVNDVPTATLSFYFLAWLASLALSAAFLVLPTEDGKLLKGRYVDGNSALLFALGLATILCRPDCISNRLVHFRFRGPWSYRPRALIIILIGISTLLGVFGVSIFVQALTPSNSIGIYPYLALIQPTTTALFAASVVATAGFVLFSLVRGRLRIAALIAIACLFLLTSAYDFRYFILPLQERVARSTTLASYIRTYFGSPASIAYDTSYYHPLTYHAYEFLLPQARFLTFASAAGEKPPAAIVISSRNWIEAETLGAQFWQAEPHVLLVGADQALWTLPGPQQSALLQQTDYTNTVLGLYALPAWSIAVPLGIQVQPIWGVWQHGLYHPVTNGQRSSLVWFNGRASLRAPTGANPPRYVLLNLLSTVQQATPLRVEANGETVFADSVPSGNWCTSFPLPQYPDAANTTIDLFLPSTTGSGTASPQANMVVRGITLLDHAPEIHQGLTPETLPQDAYRSNIALASQPYPRSLAQGAMSTLQLIVSNRGDEPWPTLCEIGQVPGSVQLGILWFRSGSADRTLAARAAEGRAALPYALAPGNSLSLTAILAPITQSGAPLPPGDYEVWIGPVQEGVTWFFQEGDDVLKVPVRVSR